MNSAEKIKKGLEQNKTKTLAGMKGIFVVYKDDLTKSVTFKYCVSGREVEQLLQNTLLEDSEYIVIRGELLKDIEVSSVELVNELLKRGLR